MRKRMIVGVLVACAAASACSAPQTPHEGQVTPVGTAKPSAGVSCEEVPVSTGPLINLAELIITSPTSARAGEDVAITATIKMTANGTRVISSPADSAVLITKDGQVIGRSAGTTTGDVPIVVKGGVARPAQTLPAAVRMSGCASEASGAPLPAGQYHLIGVLGYRSDAFNAAVDGAHPQRRFFLVSAPVPITVL